MTSNEMTIAEASAKFGIRHRTLWKAVHDGRINGRKSGHIWLIEKHALVVAIITRRVKVDKALVGSMVDQYLAAPTADPGSTGGDAADKTGTDMGGGE